MTAYNENDWLDLGMGTRILKSEIVAIQEPDYSGSSPDRTVAIITTRGGQTYRAAWNRVGSINDLWRQMKKEQ